MKKRHLLLILILALILVNCSNNVKQVRDVQKFCNDWKFNLGDIPNAQDVNYNDTSWRLLNLPHDWAIEGEFSEKNPATAGGGALPGGIGWYRKTFSIKELNKGKLAYIDFDGVYRNSEVWINGHYLGKRPYGYSSFRYELTPYLNYGNKNNIIAVKVDNSQQPNSRWYSGSGIYRNVWLVFTDKVAIDHWGIYITTSEVNEQSSKLIIKTKIRNRNSSDQAVIVNTIILDAIGNEVAKVSVSSVIKKDTISEIAQELVVENPKLWSDSNPYLYTIVNQIEIDKKIVDDNEIAYGIRSFDFDVDKGFILNGKQVKIKGVCDHHDLGCLGAAINTRALERQLEILKEMGCNGIRTSHNPPAPELLDLCDKMGFIVMDEAFDMWRKKKTEFDYAADFDQWHKHDLEDMLLRDRNHPSIFIWSIGNEIIEQWDTSGTALAKHLAGIVKSLDSRPLTSNCNDPSPTNYIIKSGALDLIGYSYNQDKYVDFHKTYPGKKFIGSETTSSLNTRGYYQMPSDTIHRWPIRWDLPFTTGNKDYTCSSYDNCSAPWGSTHQETWKLMKKYDYLSGMFIWTGFDYLGEPTPYGWPARSSYFGIVDLAGFPKDVYYMYQSEWTEKPVLHIFPHWNWKQGDTIDVWVYTSGDEAELFLNEKSLGKQKKTGDALHLKWPVVYTPGTISAVAYKDGKEIMRNSVKTAGPAAKLILIPDHKEINADGTDLSFVALNVADKDGIIVPQTENLVNFKIEGQGTIVGVDNGDPVSHLSMKGDKMKAFHGLCLAVIQSKDNRGTIKLTATSEGLEPASVELLAK
jgi:beta-galactosidase